MQSCYLLITVTQNTTEFFSNNFITNYNWCQQRNGNVGAGSDIKINVNVTNLKKKFVKIGSKNEVKFTAWVWAGGPCSFELWKVLGFSLRWFSLLFPLAKEKKNYLRTFSEGKSRYSNLIPSPSFSLREIWMKYYLELFNLLHIFGNTTGFWQRF